MPYNPSDNDTIAAIATSFGTAGIGIIRISGNRAKNVIDKLFFPSGKTTFLKSHRLYHGHLIDPSSDEVVDEVLVSYMKAPYSYTREDVVEINSHSGPVLLSRLLNIVLEEDIRLAAPGEFTFRAFINGRIDLTQAEAVMDIVNAKSEQGIILSNRQLSGDLGERIRRLRQKVLDILAMVEVAIDFPEEDHEIIPKKDTVELLENSIIAPIMEIIAAHSGRKIWMEGLNTVIVGRVNAGKSSLLNHLLNEQKAIVTPIPGTTRDIIETTIYIKGIPLKLMDTAGIREGEGEIEKIGIDLSKKKFKEADISLIVIDQSRSLNDDDKSILSGMNRDNSIIILNKNDLPPGIDESELNKAAGSMPSVKISALTGDGIDILRDRITERIISSDMSAESHLAPNLRHRKALESACDYFNDAVSNIKNSAPWELISIDLKYGLEQLEEITGESAGDELYDKIFSQFCLGK